MKYDLPDRVRSEITKYAKLRDIRKVILFGSRARGTNSDRSDVDIAVTGGDITNFTFDMQEDANTLLMFDVVNLDRRITARLQEEIDRDGVVIYEKV